MKVHIKYRRWVWSMLSSLIRRSFKAHASIRVSDLQRSLNFYSKLGFRKIRTTRGDEVVLLRNHRGEELNLVPRTSGYESRSAENTSSVSFNVTDLEHELSQLQGWNEDLEVTEDSVCRQIRLLDPDSNVVEFFKMKDSEQRLKKHLYHVATQSELTAGLSEHYYLPPEEEQRFVRVGNRSAFVALACKRVAQEAGSSPLVIELDENMLSIEDAIFDESDSKATRQLSTYPQVHSPISRQAIVAVGRCVEVDGEYPWPSRFVALESIVTR